MNPLDSQLPALFARDLDPGSAQRENVEQQIRDSLMALPLHHREPPSETAAVDALAARPPFSHNRLRCRYGLTFLVLLGLLIGAWLLKFQPERPMAISTPPPFDFSRAQIGKNFAALGAMHAAEPDNMVVFQAWVQALHLLNQPLPEDYDAYWRAHEPDNAFWPAFKAGVLSETKGTEAEVLAALEEAAGLTHWIDRRREMLDQCRACYRQPGSLRECLTIESDLIGVGGEQPPMADRIVSDRAATFLAQRQIADLEKLLSTWEKVMRLAATQPGSDHPPAAIRLRRSIGSSLKPAAVRYPELAPVFDRLHEVETGLNRFNPGSPSVVSRNFALHPETASIGSIQTLTPSHPDDFFRHRRLAEYASADGIALLWIATGTLVVLAVLMIAGLTAGGGRLIAASSALVRPGDTLGLILAGVITPFLWWVILVQFTPAGGHGWGRGIGEHHEIVPVHTLWFLSIVSLPLLIVTVLRVMVQGEMARLAWFLPPPSSSGQRRMGWLLAGLAAATVAAPGFVPASNYRLGPWCVVMLAAWTVILLLWLLSGLAATLARSRRASLGLLIAGQRWILPLAILCLLLLATMFFLKRAEAAWITNDPLSPMAPVQIRLQDRDEDARAAYLREHLGGS